MVTNALIISAVILAILGLGVFAFRSNLKLSLLLFFVRMKITPKVVFAKAEPPKAPDYADENAWYPVPNRSGPANRNSFLDAAQDPKAVDVFFVHPTTYLSPKSWNAPINDPKSSHLVEQLVLPPQAGVFTQHGNIYAPKYRQATLAAFFAQGTNGRDALRLAYDDVAAAFSYYISNINKERPFIIAGHSQGAIHCARILKETLNASPSRARMIAAYLIGAAISEKKYLAAVDNIPIADSAAQTGCLIAFDTVGPNFKADVFQRGLVWDGYEFVAKETPHKIIGFNPVTGGKLASPAHDHLGPAYPRYTNENALAQAYNPNSEGAVDFEFLGYETPADEKISAQLDATYGYLVVDRPPGKLMEFPPDAYHLYDYTLFFRDLEKDVANRIQKFQSGQ